MTDTHDKFDELMENLTIVEDAELIALADRSDFLATLDAGELIYLIGELAGRLEDVLNLTVEEVEDEDEEEYPHGSEFNG